MAKVLRIVLAEDHPAVRRSLMYLLEKADGFQVVGVAEDGLMAVELARQHRPDVVVMDYVMPRMDGAEATREIVRMCPSVRVLGFSWLDTQEARQTMLQAGATEFLVKGDSFSVLADAIRRTAGWQDPSGQHNSRDGATPDRS